MKFFKAEVIEELPNVINVTRNVNCHGNSMYIERYVDKIELDSITNDSTPKQARRSMLFSKMFVATLIMLLMIFINGMSIFNLYYSNFRGRASFRLFQGPKYVWTDATPHFRC